MSQKTDSSDSDGPIIEDNVIRIQLRRPNQRKWVLRTRNLSPSIKFPIIQLFDSEGNLLIETNDDNISIKSSDCNEPILKTSQSLNEKDYRHVIRKHLIHKHNSISGDKVFTRVFRNPVEISDNVEGKNSSYIIKDSSSISNIPSKLTINNNFHNLQINSLDTTPFHSEGPSEVSSYKSSDNETCEDLVSNDKLSQNESEIIEIIDHNSKSIQSSTISLNKLEEYNKEAFDKTENVCLGLQTSQSFHDTTLSAQLKGCRSLPRSKSDALYKRPQNKISFLNTYLKSLPARTGSNPDWFALHLRQTPKPTCTNEEIKCNGIPNFNLGEAWQFSKTEENTSDYDLINVPTDIAADCEMKKRLKMYRRGISEVEHCNKSTSMFIKKRRHSVSGAPRITRTSSSESVDEADVVLNRLKRRILKNKLRERRRVVISKSFLSK